MLGRKRFLVSKNDYHWYRDDIGEDLIIPIVALLAAILFAGIGYTVHDEIGMAIYRTCRDYFIFNWATIGFALGSGYEYIQAAEDEKDLRFRIWRAFAFGLWIPTGAMWVAIKGIGRAVTYTVYELPIKVIWKKIDAGRKHAYELEHADELLIKEQEDVPQLLGGK